jgi:hypothetical protein
MTTEDVLGSEEGALLKMMASSMSEGIFGAFEEH